MRGFHITAKENVESIMENGLIPRLGFLSDMILELMPAVFMFKELSEVQYAMEHWFWQMMRMAYRKEELTLLQIDLPDEFEVKERYDWELVSYKRVPSQYITEIGFGDMLV